MQDLTPTNLKALIDPVAELMIQAADTLILPRFRKLADGDIKSKSSPTDLVTIADVETEQWLTPRLLDLLPGSLVVGEEAVAEDEAVLEHLVSDKPVWVLDPVDGTRNFAAGAENFVCMLALVVNQQPVLGMIWRPIEREMVWAVAGGGAWTQVEGQNAKPLQLTPKSMPPSQMVGSVSFKWLQPGEQDLVRKNAKKFAKPKTLGCAGEEYVRLAKGEKDFGVFGLLNAWDHCPGLVILREAGGCDQLEDSTPYDTSCLRGRLVVAASDDAARLVHRKLFA